MRRALLAPSTVPRVPRRAELLRGRAELSSEEGPAARLRGARKFKTLDGHTDPELTSSCAPLWSGATGAANA